MASSSSAPTTLPGGGSRNIRILACIACQRRKVKCDRKLPCSNCAAAKITCVPSNPAPRTKRRRRPAEELQERLSRCETLLEECSSRSADSFPSPRAPLSFQTSTTPASLEQSSHGTGCLVQHTSGAHFVDGLLWIHIHEEVQAMRRILETDSTGSVEEDASCITGITGITSFMDPTSGSDMLVSRPPAHSEASHPEPAHAFRLWQVFLDRVNPLVKIVHAPTVQQFVVEGTSSPRNIPKATEALLFAIYAVSATALDQQEHQHLFGYDRSLAIQNFTAGLRETIDAANFLANYNMAALQALVLYLALLQDQHSHHATWVVSGLVIRLAQKMGLHRDGESLGLSPFETEIRRRVWWAIVVLDTKCAILSGLSPSLQPPDWDTRLPSNINDADLHPSSTQPVKDREGPTEMIFCLITYNIVWLLLKHPDFNAILLINKMLSQDASDNMEEAIGPLLERLESDLNDVYTKFCDPLAGPLHQYASELRVLFSQKLRDTLAWQTSALDAESTSINDRVFQLTVDCMEQTFAAYQASEEKGFLWYIRSLYQEDMLVFLVGKLSQRTQGPVVARAWDVVRAAYNYHPELFNLSKAVNLSLASHVTNAWTLHHESSEYVGMSEGYIQTLHMLLQSVNTGRFAADREPAPNAGDLQQAMWMQLTPDGSVGQAPWNGGTWNLFSNVDT